MKTPMLIGVDTSSTAYNVGELAGLAVVLVLAVAIVRRARGAGLGRVRNRARDMWVSIGVLLVAGAVIVSAVDNGVLERGGGHPWSTQRGIDIRAGFIAGCMRGERERAARCECEFRRITALPAYDTPQRFEALEPMFRRALADHDARELPADLVAAVRSCAAGDGTAAPSVS
jgi:hypothetical protein